MSDFSKYIKDPSKLVISLMKRCSRLIPDKLFVRWEFRLKLKYYPDLKNPKTLQEKIQWLKLYDHNPLYSSLVDKIEVKKYVANLIGEEHIIPTLKVWKKAQDIDFDSLPEQYVLKCNHRGGGMVFICKDKATFNKDKARRKLKHQLKKAMYSKTKEWCYKNIDRRILCEKYMVDESGTELRDYKFYCFNGEPEFCQFISHRYDESSTSKVVYDNEWQSYYIVGPYDYGYVPSSELTELSPKPQNLDKMLEIARKLSSGLKFVRIDLYNINGQVYFGEITFYPASGLRLFYPEMSNRIIGDLIKLD